ncbi:hypothetical protein RJ640_014915 [Escallonia rubra]|uniref:Acyl carrier protein n=1 Tax=Escallonia rubra TaxID=112253 RepID=A0AA88SJV7_9ASTE|nr:hypothetical protein RJ640_014915 [Escallonia rubra]
MASVTGSSASIISSSLKPNQAFTRMSTVNSVSLSISGNVFPSLRLRSAPSRFRVSCAVEIVMGLEEEFGISVEEESAQTIATVQDAADLIEKLIEKK